MMDHNNLADLVPQLRADKDARRFDEEMRRADGKSRDEELHDGAAALHDGVAALRVDTKIILEDLRLNRKANAAARATERRLTALQRKAEVTDELGRHAEDRTNGAKLWKAAFGR
ncbi:MAG: hypothetical protein ACOYEV_14715 [Candidatus Nanopelagicales bacterium]